MVQNVSNPSRRSLFKQLASAISSFVPLTAETLVPASNNASYRVADRRELSGGGIGLFLVVAARPTREDLLSLVESLREELRDQPNVVAVVFDDIEAAETVRKGSRIVGEERFAEAREHQRASYTKYSRAGKESLNIFGSSPETVTF